MGGGVLSIIIIVLQCICFAFFNSLLYLAVAKLAKNLVLQDVGFWEDRVMGESRWECRSWQKPHISFLPCLTNTDHIVP